MPRAGQRKKSKAARCSPAEHKKRASHRKAEAKWVRKNKARHRKAALEYYHKNKARVKAQRRVAKTSKHKALVRARRAKYGGNRGRPREC